MPKSPMPVAEAAEIWLEHQTPVAKAEVKLLDEAKGVLREYFEQHPDRRSYKGRIACKVTTGERLDTTRAREMLKPDQLDECLVPTVRRELIAL